MTTGFATPPAAARYRLANATVPAVLLPGEIGIDAGEGLARVDILVADGTIAAIDAPGRLEADDAPALDLDKGQVWPCFVDMHTHLDKGHIIPRHANPDGTFPGALAAVEADRDAHWTTADVRARMEFALRCAYAHGTKLIRTHIDSVPPQFPASWPAFIEARDAWAGRIDLQAVALMPIDLYFDDAYVKQLVTTLLEAKGVIGGVTFMIDGLDKALDRLFFEASRNGLDIDLHVDETADPEARSLKAIAEAAIRHDFQGQVTVGHCCSLARQPDDEAERTLDLVQKAGVGVVSLPMCNMYLQDRHRGRTPRWRGVTLLHEMRARGIPAAVASDNTRDPFYAYGDLDVVEVFREAVRILQLDHPVDLAPEVVTTLPAMQLRRPDVGRLAIGGPADLVLFRARSWTELLSRPQSDRTVLRQGKAIDRTLPDYRELDHLFGV
ncbi:cytosine deaminase [Kaistia geumhonensis]|uniref:Cytosine deaminase n=1 Tax=Kaistia geumhonensis TaxID=410839 RepID=A0ABU0M971_9HYPH|nr:cytosine deaminase [Kaistia geumhonensis]MCX5480776.1 cytosine deaminase [Kaistia geumhonensis]MDQ0517520.1 cytosine deaminase [Kaistia geumhonensis]